MHRRQAEEAGQEMGQIKGRKETGNSFIRTVTVLLLFYFVLLAGILVILFRDTQDTLERNAGLALRQAAEIQVRDLNQMFKSNEEALATLLRDAEEIQGLASQNITRRNVYAQKVLAEMRTVSDSFDTSFLLIYDQSSELFLSEYTTGSAISYSDGEAIRDYIQHFADEEALQSIPRWQWVTIGGKGYLARIYINRARIIGSLIPASDCADVLDGPDGQASVLADQNGHLLWQSLSGKSQVSGTELGSIPPEAAAWSGDGRFYLYKTRTQKGAFQLYTVMPRGEVMGSWQLRQALILGLIVTALLMISAIAWYLRRAVYRPMEELLAAMGKIENGEKNLRLPEQAESVEFQKINTSFNQMMDTIENLRLKSYEERIQFDEATLKYVQLQIRPHFFLNALTTIHSMSYQNRNEDIRSYIERLSSNIRYLFKGGLHTVPLSEEIAHVRDYIAMQDFLYPGNVFEFIDVDEQVAEYPVPQLLIHTLVENIYKHAVSTDRLTSVLISAREEMHDGQNMCHIVTEDDGEGYPQEFLQQMQEGTVTVRPDGHGIGLWNLRKTLSLMYRRDDLISFSNKEPHGSRVDIWLPKRAKRQSTVWKL